MGSNIGRGFTTKPSQLVGKAIDMDWKLPGAYRPQSSGQVRGIVKALKETNRILTSVQRRMDRPLSFALLWGYCTLSRKGFTPYEIMFARSPHCFPGSETSSWQNSLTIPFSSHYRPSHFPYRLIKRTNQPLCSPPVSPCLSLVILSGSKR